MFRNFLFSSVGLLVLLCMGLTPDRVFAQTRMGMGTNMRVMPQMRVTPIVSGTLCDYCDFHF
jgi:hypothetical protein